MLFSYRHPDLVAKEAARSKLSEQEAAALVERRSVPREIPAPAAEEQSDDDVWALWDSVTGSGELTSE
jgi:hypothetical protein